MADNVAPDEEQEFAQWLDELESEEDKAVAVAERENQREKKVEQAKKAEHEETEVVTRSEYLADRFLESASEDEKRLFTIYRRGDEDPRQMQAVIDMAKTKAAEAAKTLSTEVDEKAQERADEIAADAYGVGPLSNSRQEAIPPEQQQYQDLWGRVQKEGDPKALVSLLAEDSTFIDAVLNGRPLNKK